MEVSSYRQGGANEGYGGFATTRPPGVWAWCIAFARACFLLPHAACHFVYLAQCSSFGLQPWTERSTPQRRLPSHLDPSASYTSIFYEVEIHDPAGQPTTTTTHGLGGKCTSPTAPPPTRIATHHHQHHLPPRPPLPTVRDWMLCLAWPVTAGRQRTFFIETCLQPSAPRVPTAAYPPPLLSPND